MIARQAPKNNDELCGLDFQTEFDELFNDLITNSFSLANATPEEIVALVVLRNIKSLYDKLSITSNYDEILTRFNLTSDLKPLIVRLIKQKYPNTAMIESDYSTYVETEVELRLRMVDTFLNTAVGQKFCSIYTNTFTGLSVISYDEFAIEDRTSFKSTRFYYARTPESAKRFALRHISSDRNTNLIITQRSINFNGHETLAKRLDPLFTSLFDSFEKIRATNASEFRVISLFLALAKTDILIRNALNEDNNQMYKYSTADNSDFSVNIDKLRYLRILLQVNKSLRIFFEGEPLDSNLNIAQVYSIGDILINDVADSNYQKLRLSIVSKIYHRISDSFESDDILSFDDILPFYQTAFNEGNYIRNSNGVQSLSLELSENEQLALAILISGKKHGLEVLVSSGLAIVAFNTLNNKIRDRVDSDLYEKFVKKSNDLVFALNDYANDAISSKYDKAVTIATPYLGRKFYLREGEIVSYERSIRYHSIESDIYVKNDNGNFAILSQKNLPPKVNMSTIYVLALTCDFANNISTSEYVTLAKIQARSNGLSGKFDSDNEPTILEYDYTKPQEVESFRGVDYFEPIGKTYMLGGIGKKSPDVGILIGVEIGSIVEYVGGHTINSNSRNNFLLNLSDDSGYNYILSPENLFVDIRLHYTGDKAVEYQTISLRLLHRDYILYLNRRAGEYKTTLNESTTNWNTIS
jgi:hypothetical protein